jgi:hypothetical protein
MLARDNALVHPRKDEVLHIAEHVVREDARIKAFLDTHPRAA